MMPFSPKIIEGATVLCTLPTGATWTLIDGLGLVIIPIDAPAYHVNAKGEARQIFAEGHA